MRVTMLSTQKGSEDGINLSTFVAGESYDMGEWLAGAFITANMARLAEEPAADAPAEDAPAPAVEPAKPAARRAAPAKTKPAPRPRKRKA